MRISDWSSDVCSSDLVVAAWRGGGGGGRSRCGNGDHGGRSAGGDGQVPRLFPHAGKLGRSGGRKLSLQGGHFRQGIAGFLPQAAEPGIPPRHPADRQLRPYSPVKRKAHHGPGNPLPCVSRRGQAARSDRKTAVEGKSVSVREGMAGRRLMKKK